MAGTRSSARNENSNSAPNTPEKTSPGQKRKADDSSLAANRDKKQQKTLEETAPDDSDMKAAAQKVDEGEGQGHDKKGDAEQAEALVSETQDNADSSSNAKHENNEASEEPAKTSEINGTSNGIGAIEKSTERGDKVPSNILEKGIFYFFARGRVGVDDPKSVQDIARSYIVLRPLPIDAKLTEGPLEDLNNIRLLALPKKVMPMGPRDAFMSFVEKAQTTCQDLKDNFLGGSDYSTKTTGVRHSPSATPLVEGVYAITQTNRTSHFAYVVTIPEELGEVQKDMGFTSKGSFVMSVKNPNSQSPANAALPQGPAYPEEFQKDFQGRGWTPAEPKLIDYANAQFLFIGEGRDELGKAVETTARDQKHEKETPEEEVLKLEDEDSHRTGQLNGEDSVFDDLGISTKDFSKVKSTW